MNSTFNARRTSSRLASLCVVAPLLTACGAEGLAIGNLAQDAERISFKLANDSGRTGDVVFWIEQDELTSCERVAHVDARHSYDIKMACGTMRDGRFYVRFAWASDVRERALVAERIE